MLFPFYHNLSFLNRVVSRCIELSPCINALKLGKFRSRKIPISLSIYRPWDLKKFRVYSHYICFWSQKNPELLHFVEALGLRKILREAWRQNSKNMKHDLYFLLVQSFFPIPNNKEELKFSWRHNKGISSLWFFQVPRSGHQWFLWLKYFSRSNKGKGGTFSKSIFQVKIFKM